MRRLLIASPALVLAVAACTGTGSYKDQTEDFLNDDSQVSAAVQGEVSDAECEEPDSTDVGTTYQCTAEVEGLGTATFDVEINAEDSFLVTDFEFDAAAADGPATTGGEGEPAATTPATEG